jgi:hypothetical protein
MRLITVANTVATCPPVEDSAVEIWRDSDGSVSAVSFVDAGRRCLHVEKVGTFWLDAGGGEVHATLVEPVRSELALDAFHRMVVPMALHVCGQEVLHASAVLGTEGVVAFCGPSGAGKSTLAYGLAQRGHTLWADDAVAIEPSEPPRALPVRFRARLRPGSADWFGDGASLKDVGLFAPWTEPSSQEPLAAVVTLERGEKIGLERLAPADAFPALLPHAYYFMLDDSELRERLLARYLELAARVPVLRLRFPTTLEHLDGVIGVVERAVVSG